MLILTYHGIERAPGPLFVDPALFREHLDCIVAAGASTLTVAELAERMASGGLPERAVVLTFDDAFKSVARVAAPMMAERGLRGTAFCVAGRLGAENGWPSQPASAPRRPLADRGEIRELVAAGFEIGSHGMDHHPLNRTSPVALERELVESKAMLEQESESAVTTFAFPYGEPPPATGGPLLAREYRAACSSALGAVRATSDPLALPRVDVHYLRSPQRMAAALSGSRRGYLRMRRTGARARRLVRKDYVSDDAA